MQPNKSVEETIESIMTSEPMKRVLGIESTAIISGRATQYEGKLLQDVLREALTSHTNTVLQGVVERVGKMNEQNQLTQGILSAMEYRGFYDAGKYLDGDIWKVIKPEIVSLLNDQIISNEEKK